MAESTLGKIRMTLFCRRTPFSSKSIRPVTACLEDLDYEPRRNLDRNTVTRLASMNWLHEKHSLIITGAFDTGKTYLACTFGNAACRQGFKTKYYRVNRLLTDLNVSQGDGTYHKLMRELKKSDLLILDDWGMALLDPTNSRDLLKVKRIATAIAPRSFPANCR